MEEKLLHEIEMRLLKDKKFKKELTRALINDYINNPRSLSFKNIKRRTQDLVRYVAELELQEMLEEYDESQEIIEN